MRLKATVSTEINVADWPLTEPDQEHFFGHLCAIGVHCFEEKDSVKPYADFYHRGEYKRYYLPKHFGLLEDLSHAMDVNFNYISDIDSAENLNGIEIKWHGGVSYTVLEGSDVR